MKCITKDGDISRVPDKIAAQKVKFDGWSYIAKSEWKEKVRDVEKKEEPTEEPKEEKSREKRETKRDRKKKNQGKI